MTILRLSLFVAEKLSAAHLVLCYRCLQDIGWNSETKASVFDVITKKTTIATGSFKSSVAFHGVTHVVLSKL